jgi:N-acetyl-anhydromuramyl-L-alanine amidase AmpD
MKQTKIQKDLVESTGHLRNVSVATGLALLATAATTQASSDYGPATWRAACNYNTGGNGHRFHVIHDMEGYYASTIVYLQRCDISVSIHYCCNGKKDTSTDYNEGDLTQMVSEANYAWHALCWNSYSTGTEHEGFVSNPAWFTENMYQASSALTRHIADKFGYAKDRNHIVGHNAKSSSAWVSWAPGGLGINPSCNSHTDPGSSWDWTHYMALVNGGTDHATLVSQSLADDSTFAPNQSISCTWVMRNTGTTTWSALGGNGYTFNYFSGTQMGAPVRTGMSSDVGPNGTASFTIPMTVPGTPGTYTVYFKMNTTGGAFFDDQVFLRVIVSAGKSAVIKDNTAAVFTGTWATGSSSTDKYGADYRYHSTQPISEPATFTAALNVSSTWNVSAWWPQGSNRSQTAGYIVYHDAGSTTVNKNQQINGGSWQALGSWAMSGTKDVKLSCWTTTGFIVVADAVKWD